MSCHYSRKKANRILTTYAIVSRDAPTTIFLQNNTYRINDNSAFGDCARTRRPTHRGIEIREHFYLSTGAGQVTMSDLLYPPIFSLVQKIHASINAEPQVSQNKHNNKTNSQLLHVAGYYYNYIVSNIQLDMFSSKINTRFLILCGCPLKM